MNPRLLLGSPIDELLERLYAQNVAQDDALAVYEKNRYRFVRARELFTHALYDVFRGADGRGRVLREGLFRYWRGSERARAVSMGILSGEEATKAKFVLEYARVLAVLPQIIASRSLHRFAHAHP